MSRVTMTVTLAALAAGGLQGVALAQPAVAQCKKTWQPAVPGERALDCKYRGGARPTNELFGTKYLTPVGTCWDYDVVALQRCGCRQFLKASICCRKGSTTSCEWRIGNSVPIECKRYGQPPFGLSGTTEPADCKVRRQAMDCHKRNDLVFGPGNAVGPCTDSPKFVCPKGDSTRLEYVDRKCGPTPEDCGCKLVENCSLDENLKCYREWKADKEAVACHWDSKYKNNHERWKCLEDLKKSREKK